MAKKSEQMNDKQNNLKRGKNTVKKQSGFKKHLKDFLFFYRDNVYKTSIILMVVAVVIIAIALGIANNLGLTFNMEKISALDEYLSDIKVLAVIVISGIVPYMYAPVFGFLALVLKKADSYLYLINTLGLFKGAVLGLIPLLIDIICISTVTSLGMYICKNRTLGYRMGRLKDMNLLNFRIKFYEAIENEKKKEELEKKLEKKLEKLDGKKKKIDVKETILTTIVFCIIEVISLGLRLVLYR